MTITVQSKKMKFQKMKVKQHLRWRWKWNENNVCTVKMTFEWQLKFRIQMWSFRNEIWNENKDWNENRGEIKMNVELTRHSRSKNFSTWSSAFLGKIQNEEKFLFSTFVISIICSPSSENIARIERLCTVVFKTLSKLYHNIKINSLQQRSERKMRQSRPRIYIRWGWYELEWFRNYIDIDIHLQ